MTSADPLPHPDAFDPRRPPARELGVGIHSGFSFLAVGDCILSRPVSTLLRDAGFAAVMDLVKSADVRFGNLETSILDLDGFAGSAFPGDGDWTLLAPPAVAQDLVDLGFQLLGRANNHALDWGIEGMRETSHWLAQAGLASAGVGSHRGAARAPRYLETEHGRVGLVSFTSSYRPTSDATPSQGAAPGRPGVSALGVHTVQLVPGTVFDELTGLPGGGVATDGTLERFGVTFEAGDAPGIRHRLDAQDESEILAAVRLAVQHSDFVVAALHAHQAANDWESGSAPLRPAAFVSDLGRAAIDAGATVFITTGNHNVGSVEIYRGKPIFGGLGNFFWSDIQEPLPAELYQNPANRELFAAAFDEPRRMTDADLNAIVNATGGFATGFTFQGLVPRCVFEPGDTGDGRLVELLLYPVSLRYGERLTWSGIPTVPGAAEAHRILSDVATMSPTVQIEVVEGEWVHGRVVLPR